MTPRDLIDDLRSRIDPTYDAMLGTVSYERRICADALEVQADEIERLNMELQKRNKCAYMGPMRDCPTHGESEKLKKLRTDNAQLQFALEQSEAKFLTPNVKVRGCGDE